MQTRQIRGAVSAAVMALALTACGGGGGGGGGDEEAASPNTDVAENPSFGAGTTMARLSEAGKITVGTKFDQPLFGLKNLEGVPEGFDPEIAQIIAGELGIEPDNITWVETVSANREPFIQQGKVDIVVATYTINDKRKQVVDFAGPYYVAGQDVLVLEDNNEIKSVEDLAGKTVCTVSGSTPEANIREKVPTAKVTTTDVYSKCLDPLRNGQVDAVTTDNVILSGFVAQNEGEFKLLGETFTEEPYGIGMKKGDQAFRNFINDTLEEAFEDGRWEQAWESTAGEVLDLPNPPEVDRY